MQTYVTLSNRINTAAVYQTIALSVMSFRELLYIAFWECDKMKNFWTEVINKNPEYPLCDQDRLQDDIVPLTLSNRSQFEN